MLKILNNKKSVVIVWAILTVAHLVLVVTYAPNIPFMDDFDAVLGFTNNFLASDFHDRIDQLVGRHNEHRIVFARAVTLLQYFCTGKINLTTLSVIGNLLLVSFCGVVIIEYRKRQLDWRFFIPIPFALYAFSSYETFLWPMVALTTMGVILFTFLSFKFLFDFTLSRKLADFSLACLFAVIATFTSGNGMLALLIGIPIIVFTNPERKFLMVWLFLTGVTLYLNLKNYAPVNGHPDGLATLIDQPSTLLGHFFVMVSNYVDLPLYIKTFFGFFIVSGFLYLIIPRGLKTQSLTFYFLLFILLSCALSSFSRAGFGVAQAASPRYYIYSAILLLFIYLFIVENLPAASKRLSLLNATFSLIVVIIFSFSFFEYQRKSKQYNRDLAIGVVEMNELKSPAGLAYPNANAANAIIRTSDSLGVYSLPPLQYNDVCNARVDAELPSITNNITSAFELSFTGLMLQIKHGWAFIDSLDYRNLNTSIVLKSENDTYQFETNVEDRPDVSAYFNHRNLNRSGFNFVANGSLLNDGVYRVGICIRPDYGRNAKAAFELTDHYFAKSGNNLKTVAAVDLHTFTKEQTLYSLDMFHFENRSLVIRGWAIVIGVQSDNVLVSLRLTSAADNHTIPLRSEIRHDVSQAFNGSYAASGVSDTLDLSQLHGNFQVELILSSSAGTRVIQTGKTITIL